jgi:Arc/MetJ family transcription regulator
MKTTIEIADELLLRAKQAALERNTTLRAIVEEALQRALGQAPASVPALRTITWGSTGRGSRVLEANTVRDAIAAERAGPHDDEYWRKRFGFVPPGASRR